MVSVLETNELYLALMLELHLRSIFTGTAAPSQEDVHFKAGVDVSISLRSIMLQLCCTYMERRTLPLHCYLR